MYTSLCKIWTREKYVPLKCMEIYYIFKFNFIYKDWLTQKALDRVHICFMIDKY